MTVTTAAGTARFAPSTTGPAHPGTLLAALLCWLDARSHGLRLALRLEDLDPQRCRPEWGAAMCRDLEWLGLDWDTQAVQSDSASEHQLALDQLAAQGLLYPCRCSRSEIRSAGRVAPDGGFAYPNRCRARSLPRASEGGWRSCPYPLRLRLPERAVAVQDEGGAALEQNPVDAFGDPVVRRRDGAVAYHLASVVDDGNLGVTRIVRGRDLAPSTATQVALQRLLGLPSPTYRHHLLLLEEQGAKLAKFHGAVGTPELRRHYAAPALCGLLAAAAGLQPRTTRTTPQELLPAFSWSCVESRDRTLRWTGDALELLPAKTRAGTP